MTTYAETLSSRGDVTTQLNQWVQSEPRDAERLLSYLYPRMRQIAQGLFRQERGDHTLQPTALVHESFMRLQAFRGMRWQGREHFFSTVARLMRRVLVDHARSAICQKRGGDQEKNPLTLALDIPESRAAELVALDDALFSLRKSDPEKALIVELQYFGGLSFEEIASALGRSRSTVFRQWKVARLWLLDSLKSNATQSTPT